MATDLSIINAALTRSGNNPITSLSSTDIGAVIANSNYEVLVEGELSNYPWKRASNTAQLARLDPDEVGEPPEPWTAAYQLPEDMVDIRSVKVAGNPINYAVHGDTILCDAAEDDEVILHYVWRAAEVDWPAWFRLGMILRCEAMFLRGIGERHREADDADARANEQFAKARNRDSQSQTPRDPYTSPTLAARRGSVNTRSTGADADYFGS
jgi:hypothetical protein